jgi:CHAT domain-containing protein
MKGMRILQILIACCAIWLSLASQICGEEVDLYFNGKKIPRNPKVIFWSNPKGSLEEARDFIYKAENQLIEKGQYQEAIQLVQQAIKIRDSYHSDNTYALTLLASLYCRMGYYDKALPIYEQTSKMGEEWSDIRADDTDLDNIAGIYTKMGFYDKALHLYEQTQKTLEKVLGPRNPSTAINYESQAQLYQAMGQFDKALSLHELALNILEEDIWYDSESPRVAAIINNLASLYQYMGIYDKALLLHERALRIFEKLQGPEGPATIMSLSDIGYLYLTQKNYTSAETYILKSKLKSSMVDLYLATGKNHEALQLLQEIPVKVSDTLPNQIRFYTQKGITMAALGRRLEAEESLREAVVGIEDLRSRVTGEKGGFFQAGYAGGYLRAYHGLVSTLAASSQFNENLPKNFKNFGDSPASAGFYFAEATRARTLLEMMAESARRINKTDIPIELKQKEDSLLNQFSALYDQREKAYKGGQEALEEVMTRKERLTGELDQLIAELRKSYPVYAALHYPQPILAKDLPLKPNEVLLEYALGDKSSALFLVRKGGVQKVIPIPIGKETLEEKVKNLMYPFLKRDGEGFSPIIAHELYGFLLADALEGVKETDEVIIVPDGILGLMPFEVLVEKPGSGVKDSLYVGDRFSIRYYQSAAVLSLQRSLKEQSAPKPLFALGNPVFSAKDPRYIAFKSGKKLPVLVASNDMETTFHALATQKDWGKTNRGDKGSDELSYKPLLETEDEVRYIANILGVPVAPPDILLDMNATEDNLNNVPLGDYRYIHFATHADTAGKVQGINEPFLLLSQVDTNYENNGFLTMGKVLGLKLRADMVVLSACLTGRGNIMEGEGVANFARAFQYAGTKSVLVSLWKVKSQPAVEYMKRFYDHLKAGRTRSEALRQARNEMKVSYPNPFIWSPFILHGEG